VSTKVTAAGGAYAAQLPLPHGCAVGAQVTVTVKWVGSSTFLKGSVSTSSDVTSPATHPQGLPTAFSTFHGHGQSVDNLFLVRPHQIILDSADGGRLEIHWAHWTSRGASGTGVAHPDHGRYPVTIQASHPIDGTFACLSVVSHGHGRRYDDRLGLGKIFGNTFAWIRVGLLHKRGSGAIPWPRPGCPA
jgi:hypothetical protein